MSSNKKYYWLKLNENFFDEDTILWLEEQENGKDYVIFYLKLCLKSLQDDGKLIRYVGEKLIPYDIKTLGNLTNTPVDTVAVAMKTFIEIGLVERLETGEIYLTQINELIGSETEVAKRVRKHRAKQALIEQQSGGLLQSNNAVTKSNTEIEIDIDIERDKDIVHSSAELTEDFEKLWSLYPNKQGKKKAFSSYQKAIKEGTTNKEIQDGIVKYKKHLTANDWLKPANGSTWFGNERWNDEYEVTVQKKPKKDWESELSELNGH